MSEKYRLVKHNENLAEIGNDRGVGLLFLVDEDCERKLGIIVDLLNKQQSTIQSLQREIEELGISIKLFEDDIATKDKKIGEQQVIIDRLQKYNDVLHDENFFNTMKMFEFMKEKGVFDEFYERIKKEVLNDG